MTKAEKELKDLFYEQHTSCIDYDSYINSITGKEIAFWSRKREIAIEPMVNIKLLHAIYDRANELWNNDEQHIPRID